MVKFNFGLSSDDNQKDDTSTTNTSGGITIPTPPKTNGISSEDKTPTISISENKPQLNQSTDGIFLEIKKPQESLVQDDTVPVLKLSEEIEVQPDNTDNNQVPNQIFEKKEDENEMIAMPSRALEEKPTPVIKTETPSSMPNKTNLSFAPLPPVLEIFPNQKNGIDTKPSIHAPIMPLKKPELEIENISKPLEIKAVEIPSFLKSEPVKEAIQIEKTINQSPSVLEIKKEDSKKDVDSSSLATSKNETKTEKTQPSDPTSLISQISQQFESYMAKHEEKIKNIDIQIQNAEKEAQNKIKDFEKNIAQVKNDLEMKKNELNKQKENLEQEKLNESKKILDLAGKLQKLASGNSNTKAV